MCSEHITVSCFSVQIRRLYSFPLECYHCGFVCFVRTQISYLDSGWRILWWLNQLCELILGEWYMDRSCFLPWLVDVCFYRDSHCLSCLPPSSGIISDHKTCVPWYHIYLTQCRWQSIRWGNTENTKDSLACWGRIEETPTHLDCPPILLPLAPELRATTRVRLYLKLGCQLAAAPSWPKCGSSSWCWLRSSWLFLIWLLLHSTVLYSVSCSPLFYSLWKLVIAKLLLSSLSSFSTHFMQIQANDKNIRTLENHDKVHIWNHIWELNIVKIFFCSLGKNTYACYKGK